MRRQMWGQEKSGVGWKRTSKYEVCSWATDTVPRDGVGKTDILMRAMESVGMS